MPWRVRFANNCWLKKRVWEYPDERTSNPARANMAELREWLEARGLGRYADALLAQDIEFDILPQLTDADLAAAGLPVGARKRLLQAIEGLRNPSDAAMQSLVSQPIVPTTEPAEAERRQLTLLFCGVVGSTHPVENVY